MANLTSNLCAKKHVALVAGGMSTERDISLASASNVSRALTDAGYRATLVDMDSDIAIKLLALKPDIVFNCLHGLFGEDGCLPGLLNIMKLPYTHSGVLASSLAFDKIKAKQWFRLIGVATAESIAVSKSDIAGRAADPIDRPYVIKPRAQGASIGVEIIFEGADFDFANYTFPYGDQILVERFIKGREFTVAVLNGRALGAIEIPLSKAKRDYEARYGKEYSIPSGSPPPISDTLYKELLSIAEKIFKSLDCRGPARIDFILEEKTEIFFVLEINTHPGLRTISDFPRIATSCKGMSMKCLVGEIVESANYDYQ